MNLVSILNEMRTLLPESCFETVFTSIPDLVESAGVQKGGSTKCGLCRKLWVLVRLTMYFEALTPMDTVILIKEYQKIGTCRNGTSHAKYPNLEIHAFIFS